MSSDSDTDIETKARSIIDGIYFFVHPTSQFTVALKALVTRSKLLYGTYCGAVIVGPTKLITAAHCILSKKAIRNSHFKPTGYVEARRLKEKYAVAGNLDNRDIVAHNDSITKGQWRLLSCAYYPIKYMFPKHDIAITYTRKRFYFNDYVAPVPIASVDAEYLGPCLVSGYGRISAVGKASRLILAYLDIMPTSTCNKVHQRNMNSFICTSSKVSDVAQGDSGGPLVCSYTSDPEEGKYGLLVGIVSGHRPYAGSFFTRISKYKYFLAKDKSNSYCYISRVSSSLVMILIYIFLILICFI